LKNSFTDDESSSDRTKHDGSESNLTTIRRGGEYDDALLIDVILKNVWSVLDLITIFT
jgi:hypothetical protein